MSTIFDVPCPVCGGTLAMADGGVLECLPCRRTYQSRMGHLFPVTRRATSTIAAPRGSADAAGAVATSPR
jgi:hypothetical protein